MMQLDGEVLLEETIKMTHWEYDKALRPRCNCEGDLNRRDRKRIIINELRSPPLGLELCLVEGREQSSRTMFEAEFLGKSSRVCAKLVLRRSHSQVYPLGEQHQMMMTCCSPSSFFFALGTTSSSGHGPKTGSGDAYSCSAGVEEELWRRRPRATTTPPSFWLLLFLFCFLVYLHADWSLRRLEDTNSICFLRFLVFAWPAMMMTLYLLEVSKFARRRFNHGVLHHHPPPASRAVVVPSTSMAWGVVVDCGAHLDEPRGWIMCDGREFQGWTVVGSRGCPSELGVVTS